MAARSRRSTRSTLAAIAGVLCLGGTPVQAASPGPPAGGSAPAAGKAVTARSAWTVAPDPAAARSQKPVTYVSPGYRKPATKPLTTTPVFPPTRPLIKLSDQARQARVLLDAAGTAHITWVEKGTPERPGDVEVYCRLPRAAGACDAVHRWPEAYLPDIGVSNTGAVIPMQLGDDLALLSARYPYSGVPIPGRPADNTPNYQNGTATFLDLSVDGGDTFAPRTYVGDNPVENATVFGPAGTPSIASITDTVTGGTSVQAYTGGQTSIESALIGPGNEAYGGTLATENERPVAAYTDANGNAFISRWTGNGSPNDAGTWEKGPIGVASDPVLAGGPAGTFLLAKPGLVTPELQLRRVNGVTAGPPVALHPGRYATATQDGAGQIYTGRVDQDVPTRYLMQRGDGTTFGSAVPVAELPADSGQGFTDSRMAVRPDGGGVVVASGSGGIFNPIWVTSFGTQAPTGLPGIGRKPGGGVVGPPAVVECGRITFGAIEMRTLDGCFFTAAGAGGARAGASAGTDPAGQRSQSAGVRVAVGPIDLNGVKIRPEPGVQIQIDPGKKTIDTTGVVSVQLDAPGGAITLFRGELHLQLPKPNQRTLLASFDASKFAAVLKGFPVSGKIDVELTDKGVRIPVNLELPPVFGGIRGEAVLFAQVGSGLRLDSLRIEIDEANIGGPTLRNALLTYEAGDDAKGIPSEWFGKAELLMPPGRGSLSFYAEVRFRGGKFKEAFLEVRLPYPGLPIFTGVNLTKVRGGFGVDPTKIRIGASVGVFPVGVTHLVNVNADVSVTFGSQWRVEITGSADILEFIPVAQLRFLLTGDGFALFEGNVNLTIGSQSSFGLGFGARLTMAFDFERELFSGRFVGGGVQVYMPAPIPDFGVNAADAVISSRGFGLCIGGLGFRYAFKGKDLSIYPPPAFGSCDLGPIELVLTPRAARAKAQRAARLPRGQRAQASATPVTLSGGPGAFLHVAGAGGPPRVALIDPAGNRIEPVRDVPVEQAKAAAASVIDHENEAIITVQKPRKGRWQIVPLDGSPAISRVRLTEPEPAPRLKLKVERSGKRYRLRYDLSGGTKLGVIVREEAKAGGNVLAELKAGRGTVPFTPAGGPGGRRKLVAQFSRDGIPVGERSAGSYTAPPPAKPNAAKRISIKRTKTGVTIRWTPGAGADAQVVVVKSGDGLRRRYTLSRKARSVKVTEVDRDDRVSAEVQGVTDSGRTGPKAKAQLKAPKAKR